MGKFSGKTISQVRAEGIPDKSFMIDNILETGDLALVYSKPGVGKTLLGGCIAALAVSGGSFLNKWRATAPYSTFILDTEMHLKTFEERLRDDFVFQGFEDIPDQNFKFFNRSSGSGIIPDICNAQDREELSRAFEGSQLVILDSISNMFRSGDDNAAQSWAPINEWLSDLRTKHTVIALYHANKANEFRGSSKIADVYDSIWALGPLDKTETSMSFYMQNEKDRNNNWGAKKAIGLTRNLISSGKPLWELCSVSKNPKKDQAIEMMIEGFSQQEIAKRLGVAKSTISKFKAQAAIDGELPDSMRKQTYYKRNDSIGEGDIPF
ncbi:AAA family ATPase [Alphaproteobacteria bacterium]|nr:AAA family ATPase [Alphaproteobacteria bacterium]